jgi:adenylate cyclase
MGKQEIKGLVEKKMEHLKAKVHTKELQLEALLDITKSLHNNFSIEEVISKFKYFVKEQLMIEQLALFNKSGEWQCLFQYGFGEEGLKDIVVERDLLPLKEITSVNSDQEKTFRSVDIIIPVYQGDTPLAYLLLGDVNDDDLNISKLIKHLNFLQLLTNLTITAIENQRLAEEVLKQEQEQRAYMERQNEILEGIVQVRTKELRAEKEESERLLYNIIPSELADELKHTGSITPLRFKETTVMFTDFKGFTLTSARISAEKLIFELNQIFQAFDFITEKHNVEKIKTIGDSYMAVCGIPKVSANHAVQCVRAALDMMLFLEKRRKKSGIAWEMRAGLHSGPLVAGVVGTKKFTYDVWGDTVNTASRMESGGICGKVNISASTYRKIKDHFHCEFRGKVVVKGKGAMKMYFILNEKESERYTLTKAFLLKKLMKELPKNLFYHGLHHTLDVCDVAAGIALREGVSKENTELVKIAALFHDSGFIEQYSDNESAGCRIARDILPGFDYSAKEIRMICGMIMATQVPQSPKNLLEKIMVDADLDYLGRGDYFLIGNTLKEELNARGKQLNEQQWVKKQIEFLSKHTYFTKTSRELRSHGKQKHLDKLISGYSPGQ